MFWIRINSFAGFLVAPIQIFAITSFITIDEQALYYLLTPILSLGILLEFNSTLILAGSISDKNVDEELALKALSIYNYIILTIPALIILGIIYVVLIDIINFSTLILVVLASLDLFLRVTFIKIENVNTKKSFKFRTLIQLIYSITFVTSLFFIRDILFSLVLALLFKRIFELSLSFKHTNEMLYWTPKVSPFIFIKAQKSVVLANILGFIYSYLMVPLVSTIGSSLFVARFGATQAAFYAINNFVKSRGRQYWTGGNISEILIRNTLIKTLIEHLSLVIILILLLGNLPSEIVYRFMSGSNLVYYSLSMTIIVVLGTLVDLRRLKISSYAGKSSILFVGAMLLLLYYFDLLSPFVSYLEAFLVIHIFYALILFLVEIYNNRLRI